MDQLTKYFPWMAGIGILVTLWSQIRTLLKKIFNLFIIELEAELLAAKALQAYITQTGKTLSLGKKLFRGTEEYVKPVKRRIAIASEVPPFEPQLYLIDGFVLLMLNSSGKSDKQDYYVDNRIKLYFLRFSYKSEDIMVKAINYYNEIRKKNNERFKIEIIMGQDRRESMMGIAVGKPVNENNNLYDPLISRPLIWDILDLGFGNGKSKSHVYSKELSELKNDVKRWKESENWYREKSILWRRGAILYGKAGTGKTSSIRSICQDLDLPLFSLDLSSHSNRDLITNWRRIQEDVPCAVLLEDIDCTFDGRENVLGEKGGQLTFDCLLNCISGAMPAEGIFIFITTNKIDKLDEALIRKGRMDYSIELKEMNKEDRYKLANKILIDYPNRIDKSVEETEGFTAAQCSECYSSVALELFWKK